MSANTPSSFPVLHKAVQSTGVSGESSKGSGKATAIAWLHIPKCGTSFATTLVHYANASLPAQAEVRVPKETDAMIAFLDKFPEDDWFKDLLWPSPPRWIARQPHG